MRKEVKMRKRKRMKKRRKKKKKVRKRKKNQVRTSLTCNVNILMVKLKRLYYSENICCLIKFTLVIEYDVTFVNSIMQS